MTSPLAGPLLATSVALPGATPVTTPASSTFAIAGVFEVQRIVASVRGSPFSERAVAVSTFDPPTTIACATGATSSFAGGGTSTVTSPNPGLPASTAPTVTTPGARKTTVPSSSAPAISGGTANQIIGFTSSPFPDASFATTENFTFSPTCASLFAGLISTVAAFGGVGGAPTSCARITGKYAAPAASSRTVRILRPLRINKLLSK